MGDSVSLKQNKSFSNAYLVCFTGKGNMPPQQVFLTRQVGKHSHKTLKEENVLSYLFYASLSQILTVGQNNSPYHSLVLCNMR